LARLEASTPIVAVKLNVTATPGADRLQMAVFVTNGQADGHVSEHKARLSKNSANPFHGPDYT